MFQVSQFIILVALTLSPQNADPQIPDITQIYFTQNVRTEQAEALGGLADYTQGLLSVLSGRHPSRSIRIVSTESLLSRNSDSPPSEHVVRVKRNDSPFGRNDMSLAEELKCKSSRFCFLFHYKGHVLWYPRPY